ncbi:MAG: tetratricopeptide repeat protein [Nitrospiraceae bacterium]
MTVLAAALLLIPLAPWVGAAAPFVPSDDKQALERVRERPLDPTWQELRRLREAVKRNPGDVQPAVRLAARYVERSRSEADPRYLGYAEAVLAPWLAREQPPAEALLLRATIRQSLHQFDEALADLQTVLKRRPDSAQGWLTAALIHQVQGDYDQARRHCAPLIRLAGEFVAGACLASVGSLTGQAAVSYDLLDRVSRRGATVSPGERQWVATLLAEMAERRGAAAEAEGHYRAALRIGLHDPYLLAAYGDFLLDQGRAEEVIGLLQQDRKADALLLRLALAERAANHPNAAADREILRARFEAARRRGDRTHLREEARYAQHMLENAGQALRLARENWAIQKEPADARILLEAATAAQDPAAARLATDWIEANHLEDVRLNGLVTRSKE